MGEPGGRGLCVLHEGPTYLEYPRRSLRWIPGRPH